MQNASFEMAALQPWPAQPQANSLHQCLQLPTWSGLGCLPLSVLDQPGQPALPLPAQLHQAVSKRQREYRAGRLCANAALHAAGYPRAFYPEMGEDRLPAWPAGWLGSISHSGEFAVAVAAPESACTILGIDIQQRVTLATLLEIQALIAQPHELARFYATDSGTRLLLIFSGKESLYKALYPQVRQIQDFDAAELIHVGADGLEFRLTRHWSAQWRTGMRITVRCACFDQYVVTAVSHHR